MNLDKLFTLVVPVRDRHYNLPCVVDYYRDTTYRKIIYDASVNKYEGPLGNFEYHHAGPEFQHQSYLNAYKMVDTPFLVNCPDDDLMSHESINKCVSFLQENPEYAACDGEVVEWNPGSTSVYPARKPEVFKARVVHDWDSDDVFQRIRFGVIDCSRSCMHSFLRTADAVEIMQNFIDNPEITPLNFLDRVYTFATLCKGSVKTLPIVQHIRTSNNRPNANRNMNNPKIANETINGYGLKTHIRMQDNVDKKHCAQFSHFLEETTELSSEDALKWTISLYKEHFRLRDSNGGGGYFGAPLNLEAVKMPCFQEKSKPLVLEAIVSMNRGGQ